MRCSPISYSIPTPPHTHTRGLNQISADSILIYPRWSNSSSVCDEILERRECMRKLSNFLMLLQHKFACTEERRITGQLQLLLHCAPHAVGLGFQKLTGHLRMNERMACETTSAEKKLGGKIKSLKSGNLTLSQRGESLSSGMSYRYN